MVRRKLVQVPGGAAGLDRLLAQIFSDGADTAAAPQPTPPPGPTDPDAPAPAARLSSPQADATHSVEDPAGSRAPFTDAVPSSPPPAGATVEQRPTTTAPNPSFLPAPRDSLVPTYRFRKVTALWLIAAVGLAGVVISVGLWRLMGDGRGPGTPLADADVPRLEAQWLDPNELDRMDEPLSGPGGQVSGVALSAQRMALVEFSQMVGWVHFDEAVVQPAGDGNRTAIRVTAYNPVDDPLARAVFAIHALDDDGRLVGRWRAAWPEPISPRQRVEFTARPTLPPAQAHVEIVRWRVVGVGQPLTDGR